MKLEKETAVSPVIGVMLMLVVTLIIAAAISAFAGGLIGNNNQDVPKLAMNVKVVNSGYWQSSYFKAEVTGVDKPIDTQDLKIVTSWSKTLINGTTINGGATMVPGETNFNVTFNMNPWSNYEEWRSVCPQGYGPGVGLNGTESANFWPYERKPGGPEYVRGPGPGLKASMAELEVGNLTNYSWFGNYHLQAGTIMFARPFGGDKGGQGTGQLSFDVGYGITPSDEGNTGGGRYYYAYGYSDKGQTKATFNETSVDQMEAVLGSDWNMLRVGDTVNVKVIHVPSGQAIWQKDIAVEG
ncbi:MULTISPECIES: type IV pilin N-terminal domain-containing protein [unclassified Methanoculleus]|uniref:Type IV pilin N-terminal domain-containing protein n=1 Tax=Methanoculleus palmolei TaxID=72612 RepID=A0ABD8AA79_9EURY|nr:type IV pilin N-terminal domain-containing protein [Methanoculleus sp. UBA377]MDD2472686.1 type IV pilin N-terminal domain-containing protein [Methanoculleus sp.]WOX55496.1 type IV pilin N-terminal domain-containing protein [Methanoculleus palmolei]